MRLHISSRFAIDGSVSQQGHEPTKGYTYFYCLIPPLLSTEAPDATGPSLSGGRFSPPGRRVSGLGGPELMRPMLSLQQSSRYSELMA